MKNVDAWVFGITLAFALPFLGWTIRGDYEAGKQKPVEIRLVTAPVLPANILTCPVTAHGIAEWHRTCKARKRGEGIRP